MRKLFYSTGMVLVLLAACESQDELIVPTSVSSPDTIAQGKIYKTSSAKINNASQFNIIYSLDLNSNSSGTYKDFNWRLDWNSPQWANRANGYGKIAQEGSNKYLVQSFSAGSFNVAGGYQWHGRFSKGYNELYFSYKIKFSDGFNNKNLNGKLPGLSGGASNGGGSLPTGKDGWSARYMFHGTQINFYLYYPDVYKECGDSKPIAGKSYWGSGPILSPGYNLKTGVWYTVTQRIVMNNPGKADGLVEGYINGKLCAAQKGIRFRDISSLQIDRIFFADFFGGSGVPPSKTETISFDDFVVYTYNSSVKIARNNVANASGTTLLLPSIAN